MFITEIIVGGVVLDCVITRAVSNFAAFLRLTVFVFEFCSDKTSNLKTSPKLKQTSVKRSAPCVLMVEAALRPH